MCLSGRGSTVDCVLSVADDVTDAFDELPLLNSAAVCLDRASLTLSKMKKSRSAKGVSLNLLNPSASNMESAWLNLSLVSIPF